MKGKHKANNEHITKERVCYAEQFVEPVTKVEK